MKRVITADLGGCGLSKGGMAGSVVPYYLICRLPYYSTYHSKATYLPTYHSYVEGLKPYVTDDEVQKKIKSIFRIFKANNT